jgi:antitoxin component YwqK of YwqJK toxin-antitoxin module
MATQSNVEIRKFYNDQGGLSEEAEYVNGVLHGKRIYWHENGQKIGEADFFNGKLEGKVLYGM